MSRTPSNNREVEIKLAVPGASAGERILAGAGFRVARPRTFEDNTAFDTADGRLRAAATLLRLRQAGGSAVLTYKGPPAPGRHKDREEIETVVADPVAMAAILERLGFVPAFRYQKFRTEYTDGEGTATLDETPIGCWIELEGAPDWIDRAARALGFAERDYITASYLRLYLEHCAARGIAPGNMVFAGGPPPKVYNT